MHSYQPSNKAVGIGLLLTFIILFLPPFTFASAGQNTGEIILDSSSNFNVNSFRQGIETGLSYVPGGVVLSRVFSVLTDSFAAQDENKKQGLNQNIEIDVSQQNLENSKDNVTTMLLFIVSTLVVVFDALISMIYISIILMVVWIVFVGYAKVLIKIIDFVYGKVKERRQ